jgi:hypothetical protein
MWHSLIVRHSIEHYAGHCPLSELPMQSTLWEYLFLAGQMSKFLIVFLHLRTEIDPVSETVEQ